MLFLQGTRDELAHLDELEPVIAALGERATLRLFDDADHSFHVPRRSGRSDAQVLDEVLEAFSTWFDRVCSVSREPLERADGSMRRHRLPE